MSETVSFDFSRYFYLLIYKGVSVRAGKGFVRSFPFDATDSPVLRSNDTYDKAMNKLKKVFQLLFTFNFDFVVLS